MTHSHTATEMIALLHDIQSRSQQSAAKFSPQNSQDSLSAIAFSLFEHQLLIPLSETSEVFSVPSQISQIPSAQDWVYGAVNLRGKLLPIFDLNCFLYGHASKITARSRIIVSNHSELYFGLLIEQEDGLTHFSPQELANTTPIDTVFSAYITASISRDDKACYLFSLNKLASDNRFLNAAA